MDGWMDLATLNVFSIKAKILQVVAKSEDKKYN